MQAKMQVGRHSEKSARCGRNERGQAEVSYCTEKRNEIRAC
jgi:hypothetical protein